MSGASFVLTDVWAPGAPFPLLQFEGFFMWSLHRVAGLPTWWLRALRECVPQRRT